MPHLANGPEDLLSQSEVLGLTGLEFMQKILDGTNPGPPIGGTMGYTLHEVSDGRAVFRGAPQFNVTNPMGVTDHVGRSTGVAHGEIRGVEDGKLYATGSTTCIVMQIAK